MLIVRRLATFLFVLVVVAVAVAGPAFAQPDPLRDDIRAWTTSADRAEEAIASGRVSVEVLELLRDELAAQRAEALEIVQGSNIRARTLLAQLEALGVAPTEGEAAAVAALRAQLNEEIAAANAPVVEARQAFLRTEVLIQELDETIRNRFIAGLFERSPSPLLPSSWIAAVSEFAGYLSRVRDDMAAALSSPTSVARLKDRAPASIAYLLLGLLVLASQRKLVGKVNAGIAGQSTGGQMTRRLGSLGLRLALATIGALLVLLAYQNLGITPHGFRHLNKVILTVPALLVGGYWLGHVLFSPDIPERRIVDVDDAGARSAVRVIFGLGMVLALQAALDSIEQEVRFSLAARSVLSAILVLAGAVLLWRLASILKVSPTEAGHRAGADGRGPSFSTSARMVLVLILRVLSLAALAFAAVGYVELSREALLPTLLSVGLFGFLLVLHRVLVGIYLIFVPDRDAGEPGATTLVPVAIGTLLTLAVIPVYLLIWGMRRAELGEVFVLAREGVELGGITLSLGVVISFVLAFVIGLALTRWIQWFLGTEVLPKTRMDAGGRNAIVTGLGYIGILLAVLVAVSVAGLDLSNLAIVAGALSVGIGFGLQSIVSNFVSGIILLVERPIKEGDWIEVAGISGVVRKIAVRTTRIETFDRYDVIVPNSELITGTVTNRTLSSMIGRVIIPIGVAYGCDINLVRRILLDVAVRHPRIMDNPGPAVLFTALGDSSLDFELRCFLDDVNVLLTVRSELLFEAYLALDEAGIEIPFPQRTVTIRNPEDLARQLAAAEKTVEGEADG